mmetsp:Transcript_15199/g.23641  ORF Transcript_15199/g.23641 Transcript_15199/m.23641 type:complete len:173 (-) Transcript_15199:337-855(-)
MKEDWEKLMDAFADSPTALVGDVDCTAAGEKLCEDNAVQGFPTIKWGDPSNLEDYQGGRDYESLKAFAEENLKPMCSPVNIDLCDDDKKAQIKKFKEMDDENLKYTIQGKEGDIAAAQEEFERFVEGLQKAYEEGQAKHDEVKEAIKNSGLSLMKSVLSTRRREAKTGSEEL